MDFNIFDIQENKKAKDKYNNQKQESNLPFFQFQTKCNILKNVI